jgi:phosphatidylinositol alpha-1,6-mannosyltransferase
MRLLLITNDFPPKPGGIQAYLGDLVDAYPDPVLVLGPADPGTPADQPGVRRSDRRFMWPTRRVVDWLVGEAQRFRPDAVLFGAPHPLPHAIPALRSALDAPIGVLCHGAEVTIPAALPGLRSWLRSTLRRADVLFAVSEFTTRRVARLTGRSVVTIGAGVAVDRIVPSGEPPANHLPIVGCVSRFVPRKGQQRLISAAAELRRRGREVEVLLVGKGRTEARLRRAAARSGVPIRFEVDVPWDALPGLYRQMDVFCMPCRTRWAGLEAEGLGIVFLEAAAAGLPVLAGTSGGAPETVQPGTTGYVVESVGDIVGALEMLLADPERARRMGAKGREWVADEYTWPRVVSTLRNGFESGAAAGPGLDSGPILP